MAIKFEQTIALTCDLCGNRQRFVYRAPEIVTYEIEGFCTNDGDMILRLNSNLVTREPDEKEDYRFPDSEKRFQIACVDCGAVITRLELEHKIDGYLNIQLVKERPDFIPVINKPDCSDGE